MVSNNIRSVLLLFIVFGYALTTARDISAEEVVVIPLNSQKHNFAPVAATGQTVSYSSGDDGDSEAGISAKNPRFIDNGDGTVTDTLTNLIWLKNAGCFSGVWTSVVSSANSLSTGSCGLVDGSSVGDWRLSNVREIDSLLDFSTYGYSLPNEYPFTNVQVTYWSSTTVSFSTNEAWYIDVEVGDRLRGAKTGVRYGWPVKKGN